MTSSGRLNSIPRKKSCKNFFRAERKHTIELFLQRNRKKRKLPLNQPDISAANRSENFASKLLISIFCSKNFLNPNFRSKKFQPKFLNPNFRSRRFEAKFLSPNFRSRKFEPKFLNSNFWSRKFGSKIFEDNAMFSDYFKF